MLPSNLIKKSNLNHHRTLKLMIFCLKHRYDTIFVKNINLKNLSELHLWYYLQVTVFHCSVKNV